MFDSFFTKITKAPDFPQGFDWINAEEPLTLEKLRGHVVVLDFWTYCCINCMHTLPVLSQLEKKYEGRPVIFIGVHSAKFFNEEERDNIEQAVRRYEISHPVVVDRKMSIWQKYDVTGWPTIVIIDPRGTVVYKQSGEGQNEVIDDTIEVLLDKGARDGSLSKIPLQMKHKAHSGKETLSFPGKLAILDGMMAISDSNHNRVVITDVTGQVLEVVGSGSRGFSDGRFGDASFFRPQGVVWKNKDTLFVADTENHAIRRVDLKEGTVTTVAGTGKQGPWMSGGGNAKETALSSPWDLAVKNNLVFIAMAGNHQIWALDTDAGSVQPFAGSGYENIIDGNRTRAQLAQPSGISVLAEKVYFADSETSSIREIDLVSNSVRTIVGRGLFVFGHKDGSLEESLFQHPLGLCAKDGKIFVADTYNSALREIDMEKNRVSTIVGKHGMGGICALDSPGCDSLGLYEPSDVKWYQDKLYIADTNNHLIRVYDLEKNMLGTLQLRF